MKRYFTAAAISISAAAFSQNVGINTTAPAATLDVVGKPATTSVLDGIIAPRITAAQLSAKKYTAAQDGALVYVTDDAAGTDQAGNVSGAGYYYFSAAAGKWIRVTTGTPAAAIEPWYKQGTSTQATANTDDIYQIGRVAVGDSNAGAKFSVYDKAGGNNITIAHFENRPSTGNQSIDFMGNLGSGSYTLLSNAGDQAIIFEVGNGGGPPYLNSGLVIAPHVNGGGAVPYGMKITQQGLSGFGTVNPSETLDVGGSFRVRKLPLNGATNAIYTNASGSNSLGTSATGPASNNNAPVPTQAFTAVNTVVADANGVLGYVAGLPPSAGTFASQDLSTNGTTVSATDGILTVSAGPVSGTFGVTYGQINMALTNGSSWAMVTATGGDNQTSGQTNYWRGTLSTNVSTNVGPSYQASNSGLYRMTVMLNDLKQVFDVVVSWNSQNGTSAPYRFNVYVKRLH